MKPPFSFVVAAVAVAWIAASAPLVAGEVTTRNARLPAAPAPRVPTSSEIRGGGKEAKEETVRMSAFEVAADPDSSYGALNSNSITRFKVELDKMPVSADVLNEAFMNDVGAWDIDNMLREYSAGAGTLDGGGAAARAASRVTLISRCQCRLIALPTGRGGATAAPDAATKPSKAVPVTAARKTLLEPLIRFSILSSRIFLSGDFTSRLSSLRVTACRKLRELQ